MKAIIDTIISSKDTEKPIIFAQFKKEIQYLKKKLTLSGVDTRIIDGSVPIEERKKIIDDHENYHALIIQIQAGSTGLNLQMFDTVYFTSPHWNPTHEQQAIARVHRIGQNKNVTVKRFVIKNTIESAMLKIQEKKLKMIDGVL
jgi:DNA repair protein RAD5